MEAGKAKENKVKLYPIKLLFDYWDGPGYIDEATGMHVDNRIKAGTVIEVSVEEALRLIEAKKAERMDPLQ